MSSCRYGFDWGVLIEFVLFIEHPQLTETVKLDKKLMFLPLTVNLFFKEIVRQFL